MTEASVVVCKDCGKAILLVTSARAALDNIKDFDELVDEGHERKDMPVDDARQLGMCGC